MTKLVTKILLILILVCGNYASATTRYYQYNGNVPFIEMMLNMMSVMGIIDKVPVGYMNNMSAGRNGYYPNSYYPRNNYGPQSFSGLSYNRYNTLNGLWATRKGEMLGVKNQRFLWDDGKQRYLTGVLELNNNVLVARIKGTNRRIPYQYILENNELITKDRNGVVKVFRRVRTGRSFN